MNTQSLTFDELRFANKQRLPTFKNSLGLPAHKEPDGSDCSSAQWVQGLAVGLGGYYNLNKKFEFGIIDEETFLKEAKKELADVQIYLDLLAYQLNIDLGQATIDKFNEVSERVGSTVFITRF